MVVLIVVVVSVVVEVVVVVSAGLTVELLKLLKSVVDIVLKVVLLLLSSDVITLLAPCVIDGVMPIGRAELKPETDELDTAVDDVIELPLLGQAPGVELANSRSFQRFENRDVADSRVVSCMRYLLIGFEAILTSSFISKLSVLPNAMTYILMLDLWISSASINVLSLSYVDRPSVISTPTLPNPGRCPYPVVNISLRMRRRPPEVLVFSSLNLTLFKIAFSNVSCV